MLNSQKGSEDLKKSEILDSRGATHFQATFSLKG